ncbi:DegT/DnrJ/EryC1/StrS family aminotransferase [Chitinophaga horti]|uniref:DegT/DnrJ/EryC1/StrS family aminotransferase n=1 Tax=Chitinophaga horti TaxID=2920382 RepID=A0ABY6IYH2_9BACT|nr:DegT/DnrJ/EryC1/StrS family aminotransferase [Chitinophaga horti]UYQ92430.1 DegT/DnrJ/EryC1/StrS family aminotransferase [Chitinophaga horti]
MEFKIPLFKLNFDEAEEKAVMDTIRSKWISTGPRCAEFEKQFSAALQVKHAVSLSNCTTALHLAFKLTGVGAGDEVICPSMTFVASINAIRYVDAVPVFCDIAGPEDMNIDAGKIESLITEKTRAILVVHFAGFPCDMDRIMAIAKKHDLRVIEDACHGPLSVYHGKKLGTIGDVGCFSFFSNKNISTGEGGMLVTNNDEYADRARLLRSHGMTTMSYQRASGHATTYDVVDFGYNYRMNDILAALGIEQLKKLPGDLEQRVAVRKAYEQAFADVEGVFVPFANTPEFVSNYIFPIVLKNSDATKRDEVRNALHARGIQTSVHYPAAHRFSIYKSDRHELPATEYVTDNEITLPMYSSLTNEEVGFIVSTLKDILGENNHSN